jgi:HAD superfamily hydrolase (TIGR01450 family)
MRWVLDLDGVVWLSGQPIPGSPEAVARLKADGHDVVFLTNNSGPTRADFAQRLSHAGVAAEPEELATSAQAAASMLAPGSTAMVVGGAGLFEALADRGVVVVGAGEHPDAVVVGRSLKLDYDELAELNTAIRAGARFVATNADPTFPTPNGLVPGAGALIAYLTTASSRQPEIAGKPHPASAALVRSRYGQPDVMVGDQPSTDGEFAKLTGARFALVLSGVTHRVDLPVTPTPSVVGDDLAAVVEQLTS